MTRAVALLLVLAAAPAARAVTAYELDGPFEVRWESTVPVTLPDGTVTVTELWYPATGGARPPVALLHGYASDRFSEASVGRHLASWGFVVAGPELPNAFFPDARKNSSIARALLDAWLPNRSRADGNGLSGRVAFGVTGVIGHSAGGLASVLTLALAPSGTKSAGVMLDWADSPPGLPQQPADLGQDALPGVFSPAQFLFAEPHSCNLNGNGVAPSALSMGPRMQLKVTNASHCDPGDPNAIGCITGCGAIDPARQRLFLGYATAWLRRFLLDDPETAAWLGGETYTADLEAGRITDATIERLPPFTSDATDAGEAPDAGDDTDPDAGFDTGADSDAGTHGPIDPETTGCGCGTGGAGGFAVGALLLHPTRRRKE